MIRAARTLEDYLGILGLLPDPDLEAEPPSPDTSAAIAAVYAAFETITPSMTPEHALAHVKNAAGWARKKASQQDSQIFHGTAQIPAGEPLRGPGFRIPLDFTGAEVPGLTSVEAAVVRLRQEGLSWAAIAKLQGTTRESARATYTRAGLVGSSPMTVASLPKRGVSLG